MLGVWESMIENERDIREQTAHEAAHQMMVAARTAPKAKGIDAIEIACVSGDDLERIAARMCELAAQPKRTMMERDAGCLRRSQCVVLIGTRDAPMGLDCDHCGFDHCAERTAGVPCAINCVDVGIALGSACAKAAELHVDTRVLFSAGLAAEELGVLEGCGQVYAIAVSISSKSPFFDRK